MRGLIGGGAALICAALGCSLFTSLDGFSTGPDGGAVAAADGGGTTDGSAYALSPDANGTPYRPGCGRDAGPSMIAVGSFCVDATEVTNAHYAAFLDARTALSKAPPCAYRTSHLPKSEWPASPADANRPVAHVDWCDASAYCTWAGKRLCGRIGGGPVAGKDAANASQDEWYRACSKVGERLYPYGNSLDPTACNTKSSGHDRTLAVGSSTRCVGGYEGIFDMCGNVGEWIDSCEASAGSGDTCHFRGGTFGHDDDLGRCPGFGSIERGSTYSDVGIRCCSDP